MSSHAQLEIVPAEHGPSAQKAKPSNARLRLIEPIPLPFWDDFSSPSGPYPDSTLWENSRSVWVNNTMSVNQPTVNVATFEGLDSLGLAYDPENILTNGFTDKLISRKIDLANSSIDQSSVYLSFFYQWQGNGEAPDLTDYLELQFRDNTNSWRTVLNLFPKNSFERQVFYDTAIQVDNASFFHSGFQFRFRSFGRQSGPYDTWNLDYVYLNDERDPNDDSYPERAAASKLSSPLGVYTSMPYWHFTPENYKDTVLTFAVKNMSDLIDPVTDERYFITINYELFGSFKNYLPDGSEVIVNDLLIPSKGVNDNNGQMEPFERIIVSSSNIFAQSSANNYFNANADSVDITLKAVVLSGDATDKEKDKLAPLDLRVNDTISTVFPLRDYYAYDDGIAEYAAGLIEPGTRIAYQFQEMYEDPVTTVNDPDTLLGFDIYFPPYAITSNQTINFYVYDDDEGKPGRVIQTIVKGIERRGINEFQEVRFAPALLIAGKFYIGWEQPVAGKALVGLDIDNNTMDKIFITEDNLNWFVNEDVTGSMMVRPVFGSGSVVENNPAVAEPITFKIYPNPAAGSFYIEGRYDDIQIFSPTGASVNFSIDSQQGDRKRIDIPFGSGLYLVKLIRSNQTITHKILLQR